MLTDREKAKARSDLQHALAALDDGCRHFGPIPLAWGPFDVRHFMARWLTKRGSQQHAISALDTAYGVAHALPLGHKPITPELTIARMRRIAPALLEALLQEE